MSIKMTTQMSWMQKGYGSYSKYHPDNMAPREELRLPDPIMAPSPVAQITEVDEKISGAWGHTLCCERAYGPCETTTRIKDSVTNKVGSTWSKTIAVEKGISTMCSAMYSGSNLERSFSALANEGVGSLKKS